MKRKIIPYNPKLKPLAKALRKNMTFAEVLLWNELKNKQMLGYDFDRQRPIDNYIIDFYCKDLMLPLKWMVFHTMMKMFRQTMQNVNKNWKNWVYIFYVLMTEKLEKI